MKNNIGLPVTSLLLEHYKENQKITSLMHKSYKIDKLLLKLIIGA